MKNICIVTGANGYLGNTVVRALDSSDYEVRALVLPGEEPFSLGGAKCEIFYGDVTDSGSLREIFRKEPDDRMVVIHCAAMVYIKRKPNPNVFRVNVDGTKNILQKCLETSARLVYVNSIHAIPEVTDGTQAAETADFSQDAVFGLYAKSKAEAARIVLESVKSRNLNATIVQPSGIIGPGDYGNTHMTELMLAVAKSRLPAVVKGGYDFVDVRDVAGGVISAIEKGRKGECYILSNRYVTIKEIADLTSRYSGAKKINWVLPLPVAEFAAPFCEAHYNRKKQTPLFTRYSLYTLRSPSQFSHEKASRELGYQTRPLEETIADTVGWFREVGRLRSDG